MVEQNFNRENFTNNTLPRNISEKCELIIKNSLSSRLSLDYFSDIFSQSEIDQDSKHVQSIKNKHQEKNNLLSLEDLDRVTKFKKSSEALEIIIADEIELSDWFGDKSYLYRTTEYDDLINGTDAVVEFNIEDKPQRIALAIDSTSRTDLSKLEAKIDRRISKVLNGNLEIKYFESQIIDGFKGSIKGVIPVVIGLEGENTNELISIFSGMIDSDKKSKDQLLSKEERAKYKQISSNFKKEITNHPAQLIFLKEIKSQLDMYKRIISRVDNSKITIKVSDIEEISTIIEGVIAEKKNIENTTEMLLLQKKDAVYNLIEAISNFK